MEYCARVIQFYWKKKKLTKKNKLIHIARDTNNKDLIIWIYADRLEKNLLESIFVKIYSLEKMKSSTEIFRIREIFNINSISLSEFKDNIDILMKKISKLFNKNENVNGNGDYEINKSISIIDDFEV